MVDTFWAGWGGGHGRDGALGVLATGGIAATFTADVQALPGAEVVAVASRTEASARAFAERHGIARAYGSWAELVADDAVDVLYVATPHSAHHAAAALALKAGKHVLCEKAFTLNSREARELVALARDHDLFLMEAMWTYLNPVVRRLTELVRDGGDRRDPYRTGGLRLRGRLRPGHRLRDPDLGGGALLDLGV
ncbi:Gfo/Idh/MocA family oxidoreductase OS=Streptomyces cyaneofuscatus OX=66883 GN=G3I52_05935 PE=3 SV=1 [Streptomyces cyaneofuscatus]